MQPYFGIFHSDGCALTPKEEGSKILMLPILGLVTSQVLVQTLPHKAEAKSFKLDDGILFEGLTDEWWKRHQDPKKKWALSTIDWKDRTYDSTWDSIARKFKGRKNDFKLLNEFAAKYKKSKAYPDLVSYAIATRFCASPNGEAQTYTSATNDTRFKAAVFQELFKRWPKETSWIETKIMLLLDANLVDNSYTEYSRIASRFESRGLLSDDLRRAVTGNPISRFLHSNGDPKAAAHSIPKIRILFENDKSQSARTLMYWSYVAESILKNDKSIFERGEAFYLSVRKELEKGDAYDIASAQDGTRSLEYWKSTGFEKKRRQLLQSGALKPKE
jgi:hypothetical protein